MPTKDHRRYARVLVEELESRVHAGPPVGEREIREAQEFLRRNDFSTSSDYFNRLVRIRDRVEARPPAIRKEKRNYGGEAAGLWMQVQSIYDHVILSTCHDGEFNSQKGRVKMSHRFNQAGRIDFVELKFLRSLQPCLNGALRKLVTISGYQELRKDWYEAEAFALRVLPRELVFLYGDLFRHPRNDVLAWLINLGHWIGERLLADLRSRRVNGAAPNGNGNGNGNSNGNSNGNTNQLHLKELPADEVARPILERAARLVSTVELGDSDSVLVRYAHK